MLGLRQSAIPPTVGAAIVVAWFLWPLDRASLNPAVAIPSIVRAIALFVVVLLLTEHLSRAFAVKPAVARWLVAFLLGLLLCASITLALSAVGMGGAGSLLSREGIRACLMDAIWATIAIMVHDALTRRRSQTEVAGGA